MGRPYANELAELPEVYAWARGVDVQEVAAAVGRAARLPLLAIGSGGALSAAALLVQLQRAAAGAIAHTVTPLQLASALPADGRAAVWLISAGGRNEDIRASLRTAALAEPQQLAVLVGAPNSPLAAEAHGMGWVERLAVGLPVRDGFLATSSVVAFGTILLRAFRAAHRETTDLPATLSEFLAAHVDDYEQTMVRLARLWKRSSVVALHGVQTTCGALDLESRFTEAALGHVQVADFRNFAHGRHHWLAKHAKTSAIVGFEGEDDVKLADRTFAPLPRNVPVARVRFRGDAASVALASLIVSIQMTQAAGRARDIDPGRPGVPSFGSRLYRMKTSAARRTEDECSPHEAIAIQRKARSSVASIRRAGALGSWCTAVRQFSASLEAVTYRGLVMDYDGTLVEMRDRTRPMRQDVASELARLLDEGMKIGIATGRGDSLREGLLAVIPRAHWPNVLVGYHNGSAVRLLADSPPDDGAGLSDELRAARDALRADDAICRIARIAEKKHQLTVYPDRLTSEVDLWLVVAEALRRAGVALDVVRSSHSVDVLAPGVTKREVLREVASATGDAHAPVLAVGDRGCWPGNDYALLATPFALSVDEVSPDPSSAWNLAPPGVRGVDALLGYLGSLRRAARGRGHRFSHR